MTKFAVSEEATRARLLSAELNALAAHGDHAGRYRHVERELAREICSSRWTPSKGAFVVTYRLPNGRAVVDCKRAVAAWTHDARAWG